MLYTSFCPNDKSNTVNANTQSELLGTVNDYNCRHLGGVAGNAGIFSSIHDMTKFAKMLLSCGAPIIDEKTFMLAVQNHTK
jgi:CubicO group peptidase (beta-lactamase class C family)